ncbi:MAG TPA: nitroreductase [Burkholderiales bacterium]|nr:nitroreductase [Burkholderiales bacterium]
MDFQSVVRHRYSARKFRPDPVPHATLERILETAQHTPSWCNTQPWQLIITRGKGTDRFREALFAHARSGAPAAPDYPFPSAYEGVYRDRRKVCGVQLYQVLGIGKDDRAAAAEQALENFRLFGAPHVAIVTTDEKLGLYGLLDCGLYIQTFLLAARDSGVDSIAQAALASYASFIREYFAVEPARKIVCGISFGYAEQADRIHGYRTERAPIDQVVRYVDT